MTTEIKPLFRPDAIRPKLAGFVVPASLEAASDKLGSWASLLGSKRAEGMKETELLADFLRDLFVDLLGYVPPPTAPYTLRREALVKVDGKFADAALGVFAADTNAFVAVLEGKGPRDPLDRPFAGRKRSAVEQALQYAVQLRIDWYLVTNLREIRLYHKGHDTFTYERFETARLAEDAGQRKRFVYLLGADRVLHPSGNHLDALLTESKKIGRELTNSYYREYRALRQQTFETLKTHNPNEPPMALLTATQKMLDRVLFVAFCEDRGLLPRDIIARAYQHSDPFNPRPIWDNFVGLFRAVDAGNERLNVTRYNGGLFAPDAQLERLIVPDAVCEGFRKLAEYEYGNDPDADARLIDVEILGHIFEQSISDLEEMQERIAGEEKQSKAKEQKKTTRKEAGAFYTPAFITRYLVAETLGPIVAARFEQRRAAHEAAAAKPVKKVFADPAVFDAHALTKPRRAALVDFWHEWIDDLQSVRLVDPACGSGAFLIEAFDQMFAHYQKAQGFLTELRGATLFDIRKTILEHNLYGVDLNGEAVEIARLSCWIKTAEVGKVLTSLDRNIRQGNSVVADATVHPLAFDWRTAFPEVFAAGGFDVVLGNPPYVRQEWLKDYKPHWEKRFPETYSGTADLYVYFYALGHELLRAGGRLAYVSSNSFVRAGFAELLRRFLTTRLRLEQFIDLGDTQTFSDAKDVYPAILVLSKPPTNAIPEVSTVLSVQFRRENRGEDIRDLMNRAAIVVPTSSLTSEGWRFEATEVVALRTKLSCAHRTLGDVVQRQIYLGLKTGLNEAFILPTARAKQFIGTDARYQEIIKPFLGGQELRRWHQEDSGNCLIVMPSGMTSDRCGSEDESIAWQWIGKTYPSVAEHLTPFETAARKRGDKGRFWWELRSCDYYGAFDKPKILYPDIAKSARFSMDTGGLYSANTTYILPGEDYYLLGVLNSDLLWFALAGISIPFGERAGEFRYRLFTQYVERLPIPDAPPAERNAIAALAERCNALGAQRYQLEEQVRHRLTQAFGFDDKGQSLGKLNEKAQAWWCQPLNVLGEALKQSFKRKRDPLANPSAADEWEPYLSGKKAEVDALRRQLADAEADINDRVYRLFSLTGDEIDLLRKEVEH